MTQEDLLELRAIFKGRVQGVGFRWQVLGVAERLHIKGTVKNLADGTVEVHAIGSKKGLEQFVKAIKEDSGAARIEKVECEYLSSEHLSSENLPSTVTHNSFRII